MREENNSNNVVTKGRVNPNSFSSNTTNKNKKENGISNAIKSLNREQKVQNKAIADLKKDVSYLINHIDNRFDRVYDNSNFIIDRCDKLHKENINTKIALIISVGILYLVEILKLLL